MSLKIKLFLCLPTLFSLALQGMGQAADINNAQLIAAMKYGTQIPTDKCIVTYFKSTSPQSSAEEMRMATTKAIENFAKTIQQSKDPDYILLYPNKELIGDKDSPEIKFNPYWTKNNKWDNDSAPQLYVTNWGDNNCKLIVYNIPNNNLLPMIQHLHYIHGTHNNDEVPYILNIDSAIQDNTIINSLLSDQRIAATFGVKDKQTKSSFLSSVLKNKTLIYSSIAIVIALLCYDCYRFNGLLIQNDMGYRGGYFEPFCFALLKNIISFVKKDYRYCRY